MFTVRLARNAGHRLLGRCRTTTIFNDATCHYGWVAKNCHLCRVVPAKVMTCPWRFGKASGVGRTDRPNWQVYFSRSSVAGTRVSATFRESGKSCYTLPIRLQIIRPYLCPITHTASHHKRSGEVLHQLWVPQRILLRHVSRCRGRHLSPNQRHTAAPESGPTEPSTHDARCGEENGAEGDEGGAATLIVFDGALPGFRH